MRVSDHSAPADGIPLPTPTGSGAVDQAIVLWRALAALGVSDAVLAPGSRSAPLVYGLADPQLADPQLADPQLADRQLADPRQALDPQPADPWRTRSQRPGRIRAHVRIDERAAAFTALGLSRYDLTHPAVVALLDAYASRPEIDGMSDAREIRQTASGASAEDWTVELAVTLR